MIQIKEYGLENKQEWDNFVQSSKNGTFLFCRDFMEYHSYRFQDASLLVYDNNKLIALLPANVQGNILYSHLGLTYGGFIVNAKIKTKLLLSVFDELIAFLRLKNKTQIIYKPVPHIYHARPAEEDLYALFRNGAKLIARNISSCIVLGEAIQYSNSRKQGLKKAQSNNLTVEESNDFAPFWNLLNTNLQNKFGVSSVHSLQEIEYLKKKFPNHIRLFVAKKDDCTLAGVLVFEMPNIVHTQYMSANDDGRKYGGLEIIIDSLIHQTFSTKQYFDFGISTEKGGLILNEGLTFQKEGFGASGIVYDTYQIDI